MVKNNLKALGLHFLISIFSIIIIYVFKFSVPGVYLKEGYQIGNADLVKGILFFIITMILYLVSGFYLKRIGNPLLNLISCISVSCFYVLANWWIASNISYLTFTLNDPTPEGKIGTIGYNMLEISKLYSTPLLTLQWLPRKISWFSSRAILLISLLPSFLIYVGVQTKGKRATVGVLNICYTVGKKITEFILR